MEGSWSDTTIGSQVVLQRGFDITKAAQRDGVVPVVSSGGVSSYHDTAMVKRPGVVLGRKGTLGSVFYIDQDYWPHDTTLWVKDFKGNLPRFVYYFFKSMSAELLALDNATANPALNRNHVHPIRVLWPSVPIQESIVALLGALDDKIELNRKLNSALEALASTLFKSWFVDFDPVTAKRDGRTPVGVPANTVDLFPGHFENTEELGPIPKGWRVAHVEEAFDLNPRRNLSRGVIAPYLEMANVPTVGHSPDTWIMRETGSGMRFTNGDTLMARITPCLENGKTAFVDFLAPGKIGWGSTEFLVMRSKPPLPLVASYLLARDDGLRAYAIQGMTGSSGRQRVAADVLGRYALAMPDDKVAKAFGDIVEPLFEMARHNSAESKTLRDIRDVLLAPLLSGEITIKAAEKTIAEVC